LALVLSQATSCALTDDGDEGSDLCGPAVDELNTTLGSGLKTLSPGLGGTRLAESFTPASDLEVTAVEIGLRRVGTPTNAVATVRIVPSADLLNTSPSESLVATGAQGTFSIITTQNDFTVSESPEFQTFSLVNRTALTGGETYWLVLSADYPANDTNYVIWTSASGTDFDGVSRYEAQLFPIQWLPLPSSGTAFAFRLNCAGEPTPSPSPSSSSGLAFRNQSGE
jgi:hypothetical protein